METTAKSKGQIVIPASIRRKLGFKEGTRIQIEENGNESCLSQLRANMFTADEVNFGGRA